MSGMRSYSIHYALKMNARQICKYCKTEPRYQLSNKCHKCFYQWKLTGAVGGRTHRAKEFDITRDTVKEVLRINRKHELVIQAVAFVDRMLFRAQRTGDPRLNRKANLYLQRLAEAEVDAFDMLSLMLAIIIEYSYEHQRKFVDKGDMLATLGIRIIRFVKLPSIHLQVTARRQISKLFFEKLLPTAVRIKEMVVKRENELYLEKQKLAEPLQAYDD